MQDAERPVDLTNCDREPIHMLGLVQSHGAIIVLTSDWIMINASSNLGLMCGATVETLLGESVSVLLKPEALREIREGVKNISREDQTDRLFGLSLFQECDDRFDCSIHFSHSQLVIDIEPHRPSLSQHYFQMLRKSLQVLGVTDTLEAFYKTSTNTMANLLGFDRVMLYQFHPDDTGEVVSETRTSSVDSFMGLRYPASDIPKQARQLYIRNMTRLIVDIDDKSVDFIYPEALDLSMSTLRSVSPMHIEYLRNMGVKSSMSVSVVIEGKLWGLFALHHYAPRYVSLEQRSIAEVFAESFALELSARLNRRIQGEISIGKDLHLQMMSSLDSERSIFENFRQHLGVIKNLIHCDSLILSVDEITDVAGDPVVREDISLLVARLNRLSAGDIFSTDHLIAFIPQGSLSDRYAGLLAIPISRRPRDYLIYLRREEPYEIRWAGNPEKPVELGPNGSRLTPRKSFETWQELRRGYCKVWSKHEHAIALQVKHTLLEVIVRNVDEREKLANEARHQQDILVQELNHRVRNILGLINAVVSQTATNVDNVEQFKDMLGGRIQALAVAQNQLTMNNWGFSRLDQLLAIHMKPCESEAVSVEISGPEVLLSPKAYTTLSMIFHEIVTNALKYGVFSGVHGRVDVNWSRSHTGALIFDWRETGVVISNQPSRKGFGSLIIERSVPQELNGIATLSFLSSGVHIHIEIPAQHIGSAPSESLRESPTPVVEENPLPALSSYRALILEDNLIIGLDLEQALYKMGFGHVVNLHTAAEAFQYLDEEKIDFAILDINLGGEMSFEVAAELQSQEKPFLFLTGYSELKSDAMQKFNGVPVLLKPMQSSQLARTIFALMQ